MGIEIKVPDKNLGQLYVCTRTFDCLPIKTTIEAHPMPILESFDIKRIADKIYEIEDINNLSTALEFFYKTVRAPILSRIIDATGYDISDASLVSGQSEHRNNGTSLTLEIVLD